MVKKLYKMIHLYLESDPCSVKRREALAIKNISMCIPRVGPRNRYVAR